MIQPQTQPVTTVLRQRWPWFVGAAVVAGLLGAAPGVWSWLTTPTPARAQAKAERLHGLADVPVYPGAALDPFAPPSGRGPAQTAIYLTTDPPEQVLAFYRKSMSLSEDLVRALPGTWVTDLSKANGDRLTIQAESQPEGQGTRLSLIYFHARM
jgi:hypothetical protein